MKALSRTAEYRYFSFVFSFYFSGDKACFGLAENV
jgi:hypothetical protein